jgi:hypothetical protein
MNTTQTIYSLVIEDVIKKMKNEFIKAGYDESVLKELQQV